MKRPNPTQTQNAPRIAHRWSSDRIARAQRKKRREEKEESDRRGRRLHHLNTTLNAICRIRTSRSKGEMDKLYPNLKEAMKLIETPDAFLKSELENFWKAAKYHIHFNNSFPLWRA